MSGTDLEEEVNPFNSEETAEYLNAQDYIISNAGTGSVSVRAPEGVFAETSQFGERLNSVERQLDSLVGALLSEQRRNSKRIEELESRVSKAGRSMDDSTNEKIREEILRTIHAPFVLGTAIVTAVIGIATLVSQSLVGIPILALSVFGYFTWRKMSDKYGIEAREVL